MSHITLRNTSIGYDQLDQGQFEEAHETSFAHGAAMAVKAIDIQKFGKMPEFYFLYYEELDWCTQIQKTGSSIWFEPKAIIYHKESASVGIESPLRIYYHTRNRLIFAQRILSKKRIRICSYIYQTTFALCKKILIFTIQAKFHLIPFLFKGIKMNNLPTTNHNCIKLINLVELFHFSYRVYFLCYTKSLCTLIWRKEEQFNIYFFFFLNCFQIL